MYSVYAGAVWWPWLRPHSAEHCSQNGAEGHQSRHRHEDTHREPTELAHVCIINLNVTCSCFELDQTWSGMKEKGSDY